MISRLISSFCFCVMLVGVNDSVGAMSLQSSDKMLQVKLNDLDRAMVAGDWWEIDRLFEDEDVIRSVSNEQIASFTSIALHERKIAILTELLKRTEIASKMSSDQLGDVLVRMAELGVVTSVFILLSNVMILRKISIESVERIIWLSSENVGNDVLCDIVRLYFLGEHV